MRSINSTKKNTMRLMNSNKNKLNNNENCIFQLMQNAKAKCVFGKN